MIRKSTTAPEVVKARLITLRGLLLSEAQIKRIKRLGKKVMS